jgi:hypothetical protein
MVSRTLRIDGPPDAIVDRTETMSYDSADRLRKTIGLPSPTGTFEYDLIGTFDYDLIGNVVASTGTIANCTPTFGGPGVGPHALTLLTCGSQVYPLTYDAKGNTKSWWEPGLSEITASYTSFNKIASIRMTPTIFGSKRSLSNTQEFVQTQVPLSTAMCGERRSPLGRFKGAKVLWT